MSTKAHYSKSLLSMVENGRRTATPELVDAYERVLGVGLGLGGDDVNRREFFRAAGLVAGNAMVAAELSASLAASDSAPLLTVQTTHGTDMALAAAADQQMIRNLRRWLDDSNPVLRVNAAGILAKVPGQNEAARVAGLLAHDPDVRDRYMTAVVSRVCGVDWDRAATLAKHPERFAYPQLAAERFAQESVSVRDAGARWCSASMLQLLSPMIGR
jgi:hypothetical protein